ncbi:hypothetical protein PCC9214_05129 [Planktothrix tepida]|uniref:Uncharacterized protein n=1 Tax=Planktothrix tepida PCC 9214 TaxID=671072 RepID=A0A1J1LII3_9CYAN|nr:hypothetical protein [Planktothrix tepida]CAD5983145.1 hypothetical protein PCC9214_05129 [Planktothrix tepida]CUR32328.1 conserved hypothetical protein [Planktothrix tepida PCC 9214]
MLITVIIINILISLVCLYIARKIWLFTLMINRLDKRLILMERNTRFVLERAPNFIDYGQQGSVQLRQNYKQLQRQLQQLNQAMALVSFAVRFWPRGRPGSRSTF